MKRILLGLIGVLVVAGMFWYINTYIYKFYASSPTIKVDSTTPAQVNKDAQFDVNLNFSNANIKAIDAINLVLTFDKDKLSYQNSFTVLPTSNYFKATTGTVTDVGSNRSQLRLLLLANENIAQQKTIAVSLKFKALNVGTATIKTEPATEIAGTDGSNNAVTYEEDLANATKQIQINASPTITPSISPSVIVSPSIIISPSVSPTVGVTATSTPTPTPPWQNTNYTTTTVYGVVQDVDTDGVSIAGKYWRKDASICANATYSNSAQMNISGNFIDKCQGLNNIPYFLTVVQNPGNNLAYQLQNIPAGYECVGWEHRLRIKSDGQPFTKTQGTGCTTGPLEIIVNNAQSSYENSHFIWFKIRQVVEPTPTSPLEQFESVLNMKVKLQGIPTAPREQYRKFNINVILKGGGQTVKEQTVEFTAQEDGTWIGALGVDGVNAATKYELVLKGAKHLAKKVCVNIPSEQLGGTYRCGEPNISLQKGENNLDFSGIILLGGDLPAQDGIINALDFAFVRQHLGSQNPDDLTRGDLNLDGIIDTQDHTIIKTALDFKYDEE